MPGGLPRYLPADVEVVYLDLRVEEFNENDIVFPSDEELLYPAPRINKNGYLIRMNNLAAEMHGLDAIAEDGFHFNLVVGVDEIEIRYKRSDEDETRVLYNVQNSKHGELAHAIREANENPGEFVMKIISKKAC